MRDLSSCSEVSVPRLPVPLLLFKQCILTLMFPQELLHDMTYVDAVTEPHKHEMELLSIFMGNTFPLPF